MIAPRLMPCSGVEHARPGASRFPVPSTPGHRALMGMRVQVPAVAARTACVSFLAFTPPLSSFKIFTVKKIRNAVRTRPAAPVRQRPGLLGAASALHDAGTSGAAISATAASALSCSAPSCWNPKEESKCKEQAQRIVQGLATRQCARPRIYARPLRSRSRAAPPLRRGRRPGIRRRGLWVAHTWWERCVLALDRGRRAPDGACDGRSCGARLAPRICLFLYRDKGRRRA
jgi:hypothetical protein